MAIHAKISEANGPEIETMWSDDGFVLRFPETDEPPNIKQLMLQPEEAANMVLRGLGSTALFAAKFRESAARALLLPKRRANGRNPLWQQRKRAYDLLTVASRYASFPILLEAFRECMRDVFDMPALMDTLRLISNGTLRIHTVDSQTPSPFAAALLFSYVANYIYDGDAPLAERRAQVLSIDQDQLRELLGDADLRELLDLSAIEEIEDQLQGKANEYQARNMDHLHDLLRRVGDLSDDELRFRSISKEVAESIGKLLDVYRAIEISVAGERRFIAIEDAAKYRDALGTALPAGLPKAFLGPASDAAVDLLRRYARTHGPFTTMEAAARLGFSVSAIEPILWALVQSGRLVEGSFRPGGIHREWCDHEVLRAIRRKSLARLRKEVEPVDQTTVARFFTRWQGVIQPRRGLDALLDVIEGLQGTPLPASILETEILPARLLGYKPSDLDTLMAAGEIVWVGLEPLGEHDGKIALYLAEKLSALWPPFQNETKNPEQREQKIVDYLTAKGASFFQDIHENAGGGYPGETLDALWSLIWQGMLINDGMAALRIYCQRQSKSTRASKRVHNQATGFRSRRTIPPSGQGRWSLQTAAFADRQNVSSSTPWRHAITVQLLNRYGIIFRETAHSENLAGGFTSIYAVLKVMEESGKIRRGYFASDLSGTQFALPSAVNLLRSLRQVGKLDREELIQLAATDPANPYGSLLSWPSGAETGSSLTRSVGASVILCNGALIAYLRRGNPNLQIFISEDEPQRSNSASALATFLVERAQNSYEDPQTRSNILITTINGTPAAEHWITRFLLNAGFTAGAMGLNVRRPNR
jgi:ATP-dependent Lhr-like helicase